MVVSALSWPGRIWLGRSFVMAALAAAIHDFGCAGKDADRRDELCRDDAETPVFDKNPAEVSLARPSLAALCRTGWPDQIRSRRVRLVAL